jgi:hypothetical protein
MAKRGRSKGHTIKSAKRIRITRSKGAARAASRTAKNITTDLNIILKPAEINSIVRGVLGEKGQNVESIFGGIRQPGGTVAINGGSCCVDASVGSSAIGPFSSVGSSVSVVDPTRISGRVGMRGGLARSRKLKESVSRANVTVTLPKNVKIK